MGVGHIRAHRLLRCDAFNHAFAVEGLVYLAACGRFRAGCNRLLVQPSETCKAVQPSRRDPVADIQYNYHVNILHHHQRRVDNHDTYIHGV